MKFLSAEEIVTMHEKLLELYGGEEGGGHRGAGYEGVEAAVQAVNNSYYETLEELAMQGHEQFEEAGGTHYAYLPCLNDSDIGMEMLEQIIEQELAGWI